MGLFVICKATGGTFLYACVCLWVGGERLVWVCVSGGSSAIMSDYSIVLSSLWFSQTGWVVRLTLLGSEIAGGPDVDHRHRRTHTESE